MNIKELFYEMLRIRMVEEAIADEYANQQMRCPVHLCIGHEAIAVGVCASLTPTDVVFSNHRSHGHFMAKGGDIRYMIAEIYGKATGCSKGRGGSQHLIDLKAGFLGATPIVGGTIPVATGSALATKMKKESDISVCFFGDAATEEGVFHESIQFAVLKQLPILYICENNMYSIYTHIRDRQPDRPIYTLAQAQGMNAKRIDGNDVKVVAKEAAEALRSIREGNGPVFLECMTYRHREHCGPNFEPPNGRPEEEKNAWLAKDPIETLEKSLPRSDVKEMKKAIKKEIDEAFVFAKNSPYPDEGVAEAYIYETNRR